MKRVFVLGAGFSRAVSESMPLVTDLGHVAARAVDGLPLPTTRPRPEDDLESWLNFALEPQPFLNEDETLVNRAAAHRVINAIRGEVIRAQHVLEGGALHPWLDDLVTYWHGQRSEVITLNWDAIVEITVHELRLWSLTHDSRRDLSPVSSDDLLTRVPRLSPGSAAAGPSSGTTFRLWKLHGSIDWYWSEGDPYGETVVRRPHERGPVLGDFAGVATKTPFFAAPTAIKANYYVNQVIRYVWRHARMALSNADQLVLIGYSLPPSDLTVRSLLAGGGATTALVVDPNASVVIERLRDVIGVGAEIRSLESVEYLGRELAEEQAASLGGLVAAWPYPSELPVLLATSNAFYAPLTEIQRRTDGAELTGPWSDSINSATGASSPKAINSHVLRESVDGVPRAWVIGPDGDRKMVYSIDLVRRETGQSNEWMQVRAQQ